MKDSRIDQECGTTVCNNSSKHLERDHFCITTVCHNSVTLIVTLVLHYCDTSV